MKICYCHVLLCNFSSIFLRMVACWFSGVVLILMLHRIKFVYSLKKTLFEVISFYSRPEQIWRES